MKTWDSIIDFFRSCPEHMVYVCLRNFEEYEDNKLTDEHLDIDVLCEDKKQFIAFSGAIPKTIRHGLLPHTNYFLNISGKLIRIDIFTPGDGYYDKRWARKMLKTRVLYKNLFYVLEEEVYFYSLLYHSIVHKYEFCKDYSLKLSNMNKYYGGANY